MQLLIRGDCPRDGLHFYASTFVPVTVPAIGRAETSISHFTLLIAHCSFEAVTVPAILDRRLCPGLSYFVHNCHNLSNIVQICPVLSLRNETSRKTANFEAFCRPWVYIPEKGQRPVEGLCGPFTGISAFLKGIFPLPKGRFSR